MLTSLLLLLLLTSPFVSNYICLCLLHQLMNSKQSEEKRRWGEKKQGISQWSLPFSLDHNNTISIYNFDC